MRPQSPFALRFHETIFKKPVGKPFFKLPGDPRGALLYRKIESSWRLGVAPPDAYRLEKFQVKNFGAESSLTATYSVPKLRLHSAGYSEIGQRRRRGLRKPITEW